MQLDEFLHICLPVKSSHKSRSRTFQHYIHSSHNYLWLCGSHKLWSILNELGITDHLNCLLRNLYAGQKGTLRTGRGTMDWFKIGKEVSRGCILSPCLFNLYAEDIITKCQAPWITSWNQDCWEKYQQSQIYRCCHPYGRKWRGRASNWRWKRRMKKLA